MPFLYNNRNPPGFRREVTLGASFRSLPDLLAEEDIVSLHVPLTPETRHLIDRKPWDA
jgi:lactate dehydrogenase-like 2-hydroxyacid dehydrogenase